MNIFVLAWILTVVLAANDRHFGDARHPLTKSFDTEAACAAERDNTVKMGGNNVISAACAEQ